MSPKKISPPPLLLKRGIIFAIVASFFSALTIFCVKQVSSVFSIPLILFALYGIRLVLNIIFLKIYVNSEFDNTKTLCNFLKTDRLGLHLVRDSTGFFSVACFFYTAKLGSLTEAAIFFNSSALFVPIVGFFWGGIEITYKLLFGLIIGFLGVFTVIGPHIIDYMQMPVSMILGLLSAILAAIAYIGGRYLLYTEPPERNIFYYSLIGFIASLLTISITAAVPHYSLILFKNKLNWQEILLLLFGSLCGYVYQSCMTHASRSAPIKLIVPFLYCSVIFTALLDLIGWHIHLTMHAILGVALIIVGLLLLVSTTTALKSHLRE